jgi:WD40 repeat protein
MDGDKLIVFGRGGTDSGYPLTFFDSKQGVIAGNGVPITANMRTTNFSFSPLNTYFCCPGGIYRTSDWKLVRAGSVYSASFSNDEKYCTFADATKSALANVYVVKTSDWGTVVFTNSDDYSAISPDGQYLVTSTVSGVLRLYSVAPFTLIKTGSGSGPIGFSPLEPYIWAGSKFLSFPSLDVLLTIPTNYYSITAGKTGKYVAVTYSSGSTGLVVYDGVNLTPISASVPVYNHARTAAFFDNDNRLIVSANYGQASGNATANKIEVLETFNWTREETLDVPTWKVGTDSYSYDTLAICEAPGIIKIVRGVVKDQLGFPCRRLVYALGRTTPPVVLTSTYSDETTGEYELRFIRTDDAVIVALADDYRVGDSVLPDLGYSTRQTQVYPA